MNYKQEDIFEWRENYIDKYREMKFRGWFFALLPTLLLIFVWIFGIAWTLKQKIILTIIIIFVVYLFGINKIKEANKELKKFKNG